VRVYLPTTLPALATLRDERTVPGGPGLAVTPALREWYADGDEEELEYAALSRAARRCLDLLADDVRAPRRRVVLAVDVPDATVVTGAGAGTAGEDPAAVRVPGPIPLRDVAAVHVDDESTVPLVRAALVDPDDEMAAGDLEDAELLWYATQELDELLGP
jgi:hypothetical protein